VRSCFFNNCVFLCRAAFCPYSVRLFSSLSLSRYSVRVALLFGQLDSRLKKSDRSDMWSPGYFCDTIIVIMELDWYCTWADGMKQQSCWGVLWFFKRPQVSLLENQRNRQHDIWCLITNSQANRVAIVSSVITRYLTLAKHRMVTTCPQYFFYVQYISFNCIHCQFICCCLSVVICHLASCFDLHSFISVQSDSVSVLFNSLCLTIQCSITWFLVLFSVLILVLYSRHFDPQYTIPTAIRHVNKHHTTRLRRLLSYRSVGSESLSPS
jgi:hypothetical protein